MTARSRIDIALVDGGFFPTRQQARAAIMAGDVQINERLVLKASDSISPADKIAVKPRPRYVSRGGLKLEGALEHFKVGCEGLVGLDIGASTGGFTDCLLRHGATRVFAVDVGHGQLDWKIRSDARVVVLERLNARYLSPTQLPSPVQLCVIDVSFISLTLVLRPAYELVSPGATVLALIKPQFELARADVGRGGVVRSPELHRRAQEKVQAFSENLPADVIGLRPAVITGTDGNQEFFICLRKPSE